jgi:hypothetical protein
MVFMVQNHFNLFSFVVVVCMYRDSVVGTNNWAAPEVLGNEDFVAYAQEDPATAQQVRDKAVAVPPFLLSHSDQTDMQQGWMGDSDASGWAGRSLELLPTNLKHPISAVTMDNSRTLVLGRHSGVAFMQGGSAVIEITPNEYEKEDNNLLFVMLNDQINKSGADYITTDEWNNFKERPWIEETKQITVNLNPK